MTTTSVFEGFRQDAYPHRFAVTFEVTDLAGGVPTHPKVAAGWLKTKLGIDDDALLRDEVAKVMVERGVSNPDDAPEDALDAAIDTVVENRHLNGFKRIGGSELYIEGRQVKAMLKEDACIRWPNERWGPTRKGTKSFFAEHFFVVEDVIGLGITEPTRIDQRFVHTFRGDGIQYEEIVSPATVAFTLYTDTVLTDEQWALLFLTGESNGIGSSRSQGYGRYTVVGFEKVAG